MIPLHDSPEVFSLIDAALDYLRRGDEGSAEQLERCCVLFLAPGMTLGGGSGWALWKRGNAICEVAHDGPEVPQ